MSNPTGTGNILFSDGSKLVIRDAELVPADVTPPPPPPPPSSGTILLGAAGPNAANGSFAAQLASRKIDIGATWNDSKDAQLAQWTIQPMVPQTGKPAEWGAWNGHLDLAVGGIFKTQGDSWAAAAQGNYDARWRQALNAVKAAWGSRANSLLWIRFAHELNGSFMKDWSVGASEAGNYQSAFRRWAGLQREILPGSHVVWPLNDGSSTGFDFRLAYPGDSFVDVIGIDTYNQYPHVNDQAAFDRKMLATDSNGTPVGAEAWRRFAESKGKPLALPEWANNSDPSGGGGGGDSALYIQAMHDWLTAHAGTGPGQIAYAVCFNLWTQFQLYPQTSKPQPQAWAKYRQLF